jgi:hypothetical protein
MFDVCLQKEQGEKDGKNDSVFDGKYSSVRNRGCSMGGLVTTALGEMERH